MVLPSQEEVQNSNMPINVDVTKKGQPTELEQEFHEMKHENQMHIDDSAFTDIY